MDRVYAYTSAPRVRVKNAKDLAPAYTNTKEVDARNIEMQHPSALRGSNVCEI